MELCLDKSALLREILISGKRPRPRTHPHSMVGLVCVTRQWSKIENILHRQTGRLADCGQLLVDICLMLSNATNGTAFQVCKRFAT